MFGYNPFYDDYYYYRPLRVYNPFSPMTRYMSRFEDRMNSLFSDIFEEEFNNLLEDHSNHKDNKDNKEHKEHKEHKADQESQLSKEVKETQGKIVKSKEEEEEKSIPNYYYKTYSTTRNYSHNGKDKFEEIREQTNDGENTYISKIKRIGNRWVQVDEVIDKTGKKTTKETWHNISENEIESFENEWSLRKGIENQEEEIPKLKSEVKEESKESKESKEEKEEKKEEVKEEKKDN